MKKQMDITDNMKEDSMLKPNEITYGDKTYTNPELEAEFENLRKLYEREFTLEIPYKDALEKEEE